MTGPTGKERDLVKTLHHYYPHQQDRSDMKQRSGVTTPKVAGGIE